MQGSGCEGTKDDSRHILKVDSAGLNEVDKGRERAYDGSLVLVGVTGVMRESYRWRGDSFSTLSSPNCMKIHILRAYRRAV